MIELEQNRTVIQFLDETIMLEQTDIKSIKSIITKSK